MIAFHPEPRARNAGRRRVTVRALAELAAEGWLVTHDPTFEEAAAAHGGNAGPAPVVLVLGPGARELAADARNTGLLIAALPEPIRERAQVAADEAARNARILESVEAANLEAIGEHPPLPGELLGSRRSVADRAIQTAAARLLDRLADDERARYLDEADDGDR